MSDPAEPRPVDGATFARLMALFGPFEACPELAVAVSGGRDSLSLALLAHEWSTGQGGRVLALIVDHGLRQEAAGEAQVTVEVLARHGVQSLVLRWTGAKPLASLQEAARDARYRLLREACRERGILHLLVAHHAGDQAETIAMRAARASGPDGLAGMAALVEWPEVRLLRPLLCVPRARLSATLMARGVAWVDDPSNFDPRFERARLRLTGTIGPGQPDADLLRAGREAQAARAGVELIESRADGSIAIDRTALERLARDTRARLVSRVVQALGGGSHPPRRDRLDRGLARMFGAPDRGKSGRRQDFTLSGCQFALRQAVGSRQLEWIVRPESGRKGRQPLIPAAFFACDPAAATHLWS
ncbi:MAG: tRNA lysidine(34) synthetase TilS [Reyranella sp.]|uniref:tRNA lysidine(34) synthetase TilS n=1 Tax=Reyranella sp. TaxID=1929291 RepID=UPI001220B68C|nr:tRNA lysidine(34) synthetase TilS [Reyranella sp.]TAJ89100.1 MAG: tRNA lysidine(34) synthetase TilS [Reyranella sp.]TBR28553.1 MAG: tRNA lysidine(34) synthetase TilS [Reyranella sp.]